MNRIKKVGCVVLFVVVLLPLFTGQTHLSYAEERDYPSEALDFLSDVVKVDLAKYNATLVVGPSVDNFGLGGLTRVFGKYNLTSETSWVEVLFEFVNGTLDYCIARVRIGQLQLTESPKDNLVDAVDVFMQRYQAYTGDSSVEAMRSMVQNVDLSEGRTNTSTSNMRLNVRVDSSTSAFFEWYNTLDGAKYSALKVSFQDCVFSGFTDDRSYVKIGGGRVNISRDEAVQIALSNVQVPSWGTIAYDQIHVGLFTAGRDSVSVWYPYWIVTLPLSGDYNVQTHGGVLTVEIWADTAQVIRVYMGTSPCGELYNFPTSSPAPTMAPTQGSTENPTTSPPVFNTYACSYSNPCFVSKSISLHPRVPILDCFPCAHFRSCSVCDSV